ncbi:unnamed protein product [Prunus brigantina]
MVNSHSPRRRRLAHDKEGHSKHQSQQQPQQKLIWIPAAEEGSHFLLTTSQVSVFSKLQVTKQQMNKNAGWRLIS